ncbi:hypothetical protein FEM48_Zijuj03G0131300 [Ziziphus jujuba var. spinosa]|uniref:Uncharacterized protein n=1 Tax=Ziziphus jujuba var. spinosa TaxID=714518 RepID=A0A978VQH2_ZIZJJ|nr:hypothetical protein FEM48_Zijuj03G0131300 [Ziziphus jujuba var. spinosa]
MFPFLLSRVCCEACGNLKQSFLLPCPKNDQNHDCNDGPGVVLLNLLTSLRHLPPAAMHSVLIVMALINTFTGVVLVLCSFFSIWIGLDWQRNAIRAAVYGEKYNRGPELSNSDYCMDCLIDGACNLVSADSYRDCRTVMKQIAKDVLQRAVQMGRIMLQQWLKRKMLDAPTEADAGPTASIRCPHGELMPEQDVGAKWLLVPEAQWLFLYEDAFAVKLDDDLGCWIASLHSRLLERPPDLVCKRGSIFQKFSTTDGLTIITEIDWKCFYGEWDGVKDKGISAEIEFSNTGGSNCVGSSEDVPISKEDMGALGEVNNEAESRQLHIRTCPEDLKRDI